MRSRPSTALRALALASCLLAFCTATCTELPSQPNPPREVDVFVLAGQSNMEGVGRSTLLPNAARTTPQVFLFHSSAVGKPENHGQWLPLQPAGWRGIASGSFGVEMSLGPALAASSGGRPIYLIKHAVGGTSLARDWDPVSGDQYQTLDALVRDALEKLRGSGVRPVVRGFFWQQGEADAKDAASARAYGRRLENFIVRTRQQLAAQQAPSSATEIRFVLGQVIPSAPPGSRAHRAYPFRKTVRAAQLAIQNRLHNAVTVPTDASFATHSSDSDGYRDDDDAHFNEAGLAKLGTSMAAAYRQPDAKLQSYDQHALAVSQGSHDDSLRVITYNTYYMFGKREQIETGSRWLARQRPDVVALQELTNTTRDQLREVAAGWNHQHTALLKEQGFSVGLTSNEPIQVVERWQEGMHHGCLHALTADTHIFVVHLSPHRWQVRATEAKRVLLRVQPLLKQQRNVLVLGDFNAHSSADSHLLQLQPEVLAKLRRNDQKHSHVENLRAENYDFSVMQTFFEAGLTDAALPFLQQARELRWTIPSGYWGPNRDSAPRQGQRIDHVLASNQLANKAHAAFVCRQGIVNQISDHYPVVVDFQRSGGR